MNPWIAKAVVLAATVVMMAIRAPHGHRSRSVKRARDVSAAILRNRYGVRDSREDRSTVCRYTGCESAGEFAPTGSMKMGAIRRNGKMKHTRFKERLRSSA